LGVREIIIFNMWCIILKVISRIIFHSSFRIEIRNGNADDADQADQYGFIRDHPPDRRHPRSHYVALIFCGTFII
jgi:hypothetical protein